MGRTRGGNAAWPVAAVDAVAHVLGDTDMGLTGTEIGKVLATLRLPDPGPITKWQRISQALLEAQDRSGTADDAIRFIKMAMSPASYLGRRGVFTARLDAVNEALSFVGLRVREDGLVARGAVAATLDEASRHANALRAELERRNTHPAALHWCTEEILKRDAFHASEEAVKGVMQRIRDLSGCRGDGARLVDDALAPGASGPVLAINTLTTPSEIDEQKGFVNLLKGLAGMYRNPVAHDPRLLRRVTDAELLELLTTVSMAHRRLDLATRLRDPADR